MSGSLTRRTGVMARSPLGAALRNGVDKFVRDGFNGVNTSTNTTSFVSRTKTAELPETESL
jgi:hypothetical protein